MSANVSSRILADSINPAGHRLTSWLLTYPRFIHAEFMTHRVFSRNAASSRAIPFAKMLEMMRSFPAMPSRFGAEKAGMRPGEEIDHPIIAKALITELGRLVAREIEALKEQHGFHKSIANRYIEPWSHITIIATACNHNNFFGLRAHPAADPTFQELAYGMLEKYLTNEPRPIEWDDWHIPEFTHPTGKIKDNPDYWADGFNIETRLKIATARCARLSYLTFDGDFSPEKDIELHDRLLGPPFHASPFEHCAQALDPDDTVDAAKLLANLSNFDECGMPVGWMQYRKQFPNENGNNVNLAEILATKPEWLS